MITSFAILSVLVSVSFCGQIAPGTNSRPILTAAEAARFTKQAYLQGWTPEGISTSRADYTVGTGGYSTIQAAVNAAITAGGTTRKYIKIAAGTYNEIVYIPSTEVPLTLFGGGGSSSATVISATLSASTTGSGYTSLFGHLFKVGDPGYRMYSVCAGRPIIGTSCSSVVWVDAPNVEIINLTIQNLSKKPGTDQAVALFTQADKVQVSNCRLLGHQDTFWAGFTETINRGLITNTYIEGDTDFVYGGGSYVFEGCVFHVKSDRSNFAVIFAPGTPAKIQYGYLVIKSTITGDSSWLTSKSAGLARSWDFGVSSAGGYVAGTSPNGQLVIRESTIDAIIPRAAPYLPATSGRAFSGNGASNRDLNNNNYNRIWEYENIGNGA